MVDLNALNSILSVRNAVVAMALVNVLIGWRVWILIPGVMERWNERRRDRASIEADQYERMERRLKTVEERHDDCERNLSEERAQRHKDVSSLRDDLARERAERMKLQAIIDGWGQVRQAAAQAEAEVRADPSKAIESLKRFNGDKGEGK